MDDEQLLAILSDERKNSIGFDEDDTLAADREKALNYYKGEMPDVPALPNRSKAVSTDVADAIETILPDLVEIFTGEDVATFTPVGPEDEEAAQQETDYINHVFFDQNPGFLNLTTFFKDACLSKTGIMTWWWEEPRYGEEEVFEGRTAMEAQSLQQYGEVVSVEPEGLQVPQAEPTFTVTLRQVLKKGCVKIRCFPPEDFTVGRDTVWLPEGTYCALRSRRRIQDLIEDGIDSELAESLTSYGDEDTTLDTARDTADENEDRPEGIGPLRMVEVVQHFIRLEGKILSVLTGNDEKVILDQREVSHVQAAAITPYMMTHRFYGESVADKLLEIARIKTALTRMALDSGYFALNQRMQVDVSQANEWTLTDLMRNEPMMPVRVNQIGAVAPIQSGGLSFDAFGALEYFETMGEKRTGIVRNAQGLNPDTLHDTAKGMQALVSAAQKRVRFIARQFAETGVKDAFIGIHTLIRENVTSAEKARLRNKWVEIDPTTWGSRQDMTIEIGLGSSGVDQELQKLRFIGDALTEIRQDPQFASMVTPVNVYNLVSRLIQKSGFKAPELFITDPSQQQQQGGQTDPAQQQAQAEMQMEQQKLAMQVQADQAKAQADITIQREKLAAETELKRYQIDAEIQLKERQLGAELQMKREMAMFSAANPGPSDIHVGGQPG